MSATDCKKAMPEGCKTTEKAKEGACSTPKGQPQGPGPWARGWFGGHPGAGGTKEGGSHPEGESRWAEWQKIMEQRRKENCKCDKKDTESSEVKCSCPPGPRGGRGGSGPPPYWVMMMMMSGMKGKGGPQGDQHQWGPPPGVEGQEGHQHRQGPPPEIMQQMMQGGGGGWFSGMKHMFGWGGAKPCMPAEGGQPFQHPGAKCHGKDFSQGHGCQKKTDSCCT